MRLVTLLLDLLFRAVGRTEYVEMRQRESFAEVMDRYTRSPK